MTKIKKTSLVIMTPVAHMPVVDRWKIIYPENAIFTDFIAFPELIKNLYPYLQNVIQRDRNVINDNSSGVLI